MARAAHAADPTSGQMLRAANAGDRTPIELEPARMERLLAWAEDVAHVIPPQQLPGATPAASDAWDELARRRVRVLRQARADEILLVAM